MSKLRAHVSRGEYKGEELLPHRHRDGSFVASPSRFEADYIRVESEEELEALARAGYGVRMSSSTIPRAASLISSSSIEFPSQDGSPVTISTLLPGIIEDSDLDRDSKIKARKEQNFLRAHLLAGRANAPCTICGRQLPEPLLVAAHIKRRSECSHAEKLDFANVAALMCRLGCDELFEKGYVVVEAGAVTRNDSRKHTSASEEAVSALLGNVVKNWSGSEEYYKWHYKYHK